MPLRVGWFEPDLAGLNPNLQKMRRLGGRGIELTMPHSSSCAHKLNLPGIENPLVAEAVAMCQRTFQHIAENLHVPVRMLRKTLPGCDDIVVDDPQAPEPHVGGITVIRKTESVTTPEPSVIGKTAL